MYFGEKFIPVKERTDVGARSGRYPLQEQVIAFLSLVLNAGNVAKQKEYGQANTRISDRKEIISLKSRGGFPKTLKKDDQSSFDKELSSKSRSFKF